MTDLNGSLNDLAIDYAKRTGFPHKQGEGARLAYVPDIADAMLAFHEEAVAQLNRRVTHQAEQPQDVLERVARNYAKVYYHDYRHKDECVEKHWECFVPAAKAAIAAMEGIGSDAGQSLQNSDAGLSASIPSPSDSPSGYPDDDGTACNCYWHRTGKFDDREFMCGPAEEARELLVMGDAGNYSARNPTGTVGVKVPEATSPANTSEIPDTAISEMADYIWHKTQRGESGISRSMVADKIKEGIAPYLRTTEPDEGPLTREEIVKQSQHLSKQYDAALDEIDKLRAREPVSIKRTVNKLGSYPKGEMASDVVKQVLDAAGVKYVD